MTFLSHIGYVRKPKVGSCFYCGKQVSPGNIGAGNATWDHKLPVCRGGVTLPANLELSCAGCNGDKGALTFEQYREFLLFRMRFSALRRNQDAGIRITNYRFWGERATAY